MWVGDFECEIPGVFSYVFLTSILYIDYKNHNESIFWSSRYTWTTRPIRKYDEYE